MATYKVKCAKIAGMEKGKTVSEADFAKGVNVQALVAGGHLEEVTKVQAMKPMEAKSTEVKSDKE